MKKRYVTYIAIVIIAAVAFFLYFSTGFVSLSIKNSGSEKVEVLFYSKGSYENLAVLDGGQKDRIFSFPVSSGNYRVLCLDGTRNRAYDFGYFSFDLRIIYDVEIRCNKYVRVKSKILI